MVVPLIRGLDSYFEHLEFISHYEAIVKSPKAFI